MNHPTNRAERLSIRSKKNEQRLKNKENREARLLRQQLLKKEAEDGPADGEL